MGLLFGTILGAVTALGVVFSPLLQRWVMPVLVLSQAIPVFALAPLLVLWLGFGMSSKVLMAVLVIFFPVTASFSDGLRRTDPGWLDLAHTMNASPWAVLRHVRLMAGLPSFASVGASAGLGFVMINADARIQTDVMFAALLILAVVAITLYVIVDRLLRWMLYWSPDTTGGHERRRQ